MSALSMDNIAQAAQEKGGDLGKIERAFVTQGKSAGRTFQRSNTSGSLSSRMNKRQNVMDRVNRNRQRHGSGSAAWAEHTGFRDGFEPIGV